MSRQPQTGVRRPEPAATRPEGAGPEGAGPEGAALEDAGPAGTAARDGHERRDDPARVEASERRALGRALRQRSDHILWACQERFLQGSDGGDRDAVARDPMWNITSVAVAAIASWLETGEVAGQRERDEIASLGHAAAKHEVRASLRSWGEAGPESGDLSVAKLMKLNLWWREITCRVLTEEGARLGTSRATVQAATDMVDASCSSSMVQMAKRFDAELQRLHEQLSYLARHDPLTGLANRPVLLDQLDTAIGRLNRRGGGLAVAFIDLDNFKSVNDAFGHVVGDELLVGVADRFSSRMRPGDTMARFGGDEFVTLFEDLTAPATSSSTLAARLLGVMGEPFESTRGQLEITASIGVAAVTGPGCRSEDVLSQADDAMYTAKRAGRNRVVAVEVGGPVAPHQPCVRRWVPSSRR